MFGGIGELFKGLDFNNLDFVGIANKLVHLVPNGKAKQAMDIAMSVAKNGGEPKDLKKALEDTLPPDQRQKLQSIDVWRNIPNDKDAIESYGKNVAKQFQVMK